jgi:hypothetical protein
MSFTWWPLQAQLIDQILGTSDHPDVPKARKCLDEILERTGVKICPDCGGQGGYVDYYPGIDINDICHDCPSCVKGMIMKGKT